MDSRLIITFVVILLCSSVHTSNHWKDFEANDIYPYYDTSNCYFPFTYKSKTYNNCTSDGDNGNRPWCPIMPDYNGVFTYCYDFWRTSLTCGIQPGTNTPYPCVHMTPRSLYKQCRTSHSKYKLLNCISEHIKKSGQPLYHPNDCNSTYKTMTKLHSKCAGPSDFAIPIPMTEENKQAILDQHNEYRAAVPSRYMFKLYWDDTLADMAQTHANMCAFDHDLSVNRFTISFKWKNGQNMIFATGYTTDLTDLFTIMFDSEKERFFHGVGCKPDGSCTHYTQLMLSNMTRVGCAETHCLYPDRVERQIVCNYVHSQYTDNYMIPYIPSRIPAIDCPSKNVSGLCDCRNKTCQYHKNEYLHPNTCECIAPISKRSLNENELNERAADEESVVYAPSGDNIDTDRRIKRDIRRFPFLNMRDKRMREISGHGTENDK